MSRYLSFFGPAVVVSDDSLEMVILNIYVIYSHIYGYIQDFISKWTLVKMIITVHLSFVLGICSKLFAYKIICELYRSVLASYSEKHSLEHSIDCQQFDEGVEI